MFIIYLPFLKKEIQIMCVKVIQTVQTQYDIVGSVTGVLQTKQVCT